MFIKSYYRNFLSWLMVVIFLSAQVSNGDQFGDEQDKVNTI